jgi:hypothetical protein
MTMLLRFGIVICFRRGQGLAREDEMENTWMEPDKNNRFLAQHVELMLDSLQRWTGKKLFPDAINDEERAKRLFFAPFALVSHNMAADPIFNYANRTALALFEMSWEEFTGLPSRLSAEPMHRDERARLMAEVARNGYIANYGGIRISKSGRRFRIEDALIWNLLDQTGQVCGQAALFERWRFLA